MVKHEHGPELNRKRLPTLFEVLSRQTLPPVDLFSFYIYMRDQQKSVDYLDFWLDISQHMSLCRHYVRELRRSVMVSTPDLEKSGSKRSSAILESLGDMSHPAGPSMAQTEKEKTQDAQMSAFLREELHENSGNNNNNNNGHVNGHSPHGSLATNNSRQQQLAAPPSRDRDRPRPSFMSSPLELTTDSNSPSQAVAQADIRASAERILFTYLIRDAEREIILPADIVAEVTQYIEQEGRSDPELFDRAKDYVFQAMERDAFPGFLRMKALGNLVPKSLMIRLITGMVALFAGFWLSFVLIFLDAPRTQRAYEVIPFLIGVYMLISHQYSVDPIMGLLGFSEYSLFNLAKIREPYVRQILVKRSVVVGAVTLFTALVLTIIFVFVPGKRL